MPKKYLAAVKAIKAAIRAGRIPKHYYKHGHRYESNPYAIARYATGYHGTTHDIGLVHRIKKKIHSKHHKNQAKNLINREIKRSIRALR
jgi:hypothetical protein